MEMYDVLFFVGGVLISIIGYFIRSIMDENKSIKLMAYDTKSQLEVLKNDHANKYVNLTDRMDELKEVIKDLLSEIKKLNSR